jgi:hypothetical protein
VALLQDLNREEVHQRLLPASKAQMAEARQDARCSDIGVRHTATAVSVNAADCGWP